MFQFLKGYAFLLELSYLAFLLSFYLRSVSFCVLALVKLTFKSWTWAEEVHYGGLIAVIPLKGASAF